MGSLRDWEKSEIEFKDAISAFGKSAFLYRITDTKEANRGRVGQKVVVKNTPSDFLLTYKGKMAYTEVKHCSNPTSFPFSGLTVGQKQAILKQEKAGGRYIIFVYSAKHKTWYYITEELYLTYLEKGSKSITWKDLYNFKWDKKCIPI